MAKKKQDPPAGAEAPEGGTKKKKYEYFRGSFTVGKKEDGSPDRIWVYGKTEEERDENLREAKRRHGLGLTQADMTVREWSKLWMDVFKAKATDTQRDHYQAKLTHDILPAIGNMMIKDVRPSHLIKLLNSYSGGNKWTVGKIRIAIQQLFADAAYEGVIERDPAARLELPPDLEENPRRPLTCLEREIVLKVAETHPRGPWFLTLYYCGLRIAEGAALDRKAVDLDNKRMTVNKALTLSKGRNELSTTKGEKLRKKRRKGEEDVGTRVVPIPDKLVPALAKACEGKKPNDILYPKADGKHATMCALLGWMRSFKRHCHIAAGAKLYRNKVLVETSPFGDEVTSHYLRHTYGTDMHAAKLDLKTRQEFLGHAEDSVTDKVYTAMSNVAFKRSAALMNEYHENRGWCDHECVNALKRWQEMAEEDRAEYGDVFGAYLAYTFSPEGVLLHQNDLEEEEEED